MEKIFCTDPARTTPVIPRSYHPLAVDKIASTVPRVIYQRQFKNQFSDWEWTRTELKITLSNKMWIDHWAVVVVVKWSACLPYTPTIRVSILLTRLKWTKINKKEAGVGHFLKKMWIDGKIAPLIASSPTEKKNDRLGWTITVKSKFKVFGVGRRRALKRLVHFK